jgi:hypothetical protein
MASRFEHWNTHTYRGSANTSLPPVGMVVVPVVRFRLVIVGWVLLSHSAARGFERLSLCIPSIIRLPDCCNSASISGRRRIYHCRPLVNSRTLLLTGSSPPKSTGNTGFRLVMPEGQDVCSAPLLLCHYAAVRHVREATSNIALQARSEASPSGRTAGKSIFKDALRFT